MSRKRIVIGNIYGLLLILEGDRKEFDLCTKRVIHDLQIIENLHIAPTETKKIKETYAQQAEKI